MTIMRVSRIKHIFCQTSFWRRDIRGRWWRVQGDRHERILIWRNCYEERRTRLARVLIKDTKEFFH
jgi:hypothetical protein